MFSKNIISERGIFDRCINFTNKIILIKKDKGNKETTLKIFSINNLAKYKKKATFKGNYQFLSVMLDGSILFKYSGYLIRICSTNLTLISSHLCKKNYLPIGVIDNSTFFVIEKEYDPSCQVLTIFLEDCSNGLNSFKEVDKINLSSDSEIPNGQIFKIQSLGENRYCCMLSNYNNQEQEFNVLVFNIDPTNYTINVIGLIKPEPPQAKETFRDLLILDVLPNNQLLTYYKFDNIVQIWDLNTLQCIKKWYWTKVQKPEDFYAGNLGLFPYPDSINLLVIHYYTNKIYLFNTDDLILNQIALKNKPGSYQNCHILPNGQVLAIKDKQEGHFEMFPLSSEPITLPKELSYTSKDFF